MNSSVDESEFDVRVTRVVVLDDILCVDLEDGRTLQLPLAWYPRLMHGTPAERANIEIDHYGISWPDLDEDLSIKGLILGRKSGENPHIIKWWLEQRGKGRRVTLEDYMREKAKSKASVPKRRKAG